VDISKQTTDSEKEDQKKKQEKKDKYKVKFWINIRFTNSCLKDLSIFYNRA
jgi:hypothetical protein